MSNDNSSLFDLISFVRLRDSTNPNKNDVLSASGSDKGRVINSSAFRRLQQKAQVFPLDDNASVRTRLTHSVEVSQVGSYLAQEVIKNLGVDKVEYDKKVSFVNTVESSCLLHDIGNPPFGHLGEAAIRKWACDFHARNNATNKELKFFDGNAQGLRFSTFLGGVDRYGLNLSASLILSSIKYPVTYTENNKGNKIKSGIFENEKEVYLEACDKLNWPLKKVFPLAKLMETADDISYCMSDLEDGLEKGVVTSDMLCDEFDDYKSIVDDPEQNVVSEFIRYKTNLINNAVSEAARKFANNIDEVLSGDDVCLIHEKSEVGKKIKHIKSFAMKHIYSDDTVEKIEIAGNSAISGILHSFDSILSLSYSEFMRLKECDKKFIRDNNLEFDYRLFKRLPCSYVKKYEMICERQSTEDELLARLHLITDFVAGMTDSFSVYFYQVISGINIR